MRTNFAKFISAVLLSFVLVSPSFAQAKYEELMDKADNLIKSGNFVEAFSVAQEAIKLDGNQFTAYYYAAFSLYKRGLLAEAEPYAKDAVSRATVTDKPTAEKLLNTITGLRVYKEQVQIGDQAIRDGLINKAAIAYTKAFDGNAAQSEIGLKAANLWIERLDNVLEGARILKTISNGAGNPSDVRTARDLFDGLKLRLFAEFEKLDNRSRSSETAKKPGEAIPLLLDLIQTFDSLIDPTGVFQKNAEPSAIETGRQGLHLRLLKMYSLGNNNARAINEFAEIIKAGTVDLGYLLTTEYLDQLIFDSSFQAFVIDSIGPKEAEKVKRATNFDGTMEQLRLAIATYRTESTRNRSDTDTGRQLMEIERKYGEKGRDDFYQDIRWVSSFNGCTFTYNHDKRVNGKRQKDESSSYSVDLSKVSRVTKVAGVTPSFARIILDLNNGSPSISLPVDFDLGALTNAVRLCKRQPIR
jgi:tetratricopeptide (TPR) repeat protein